MLLIRGYTSEESDTAADFQKKAEAFIQEGWQGSIYALWWDASKKSTLFYTLTPLHWRKVKARATKVGEEYFLSTLEPIRTTTIATSLEGRLFNLYSNDDSVLKMIYRIGEMRTGRPCGYKPFEFAHPKVRNSNISQFIEVSEQDVHGCYWDVLPTILRDEVYRNAPSNL